MRIKDITDYLESHAPLALQEDYDNSGLLIGTAEGDVESVLISLDVTPDVVDEAIERGCGLIISHHPLIFRGLKRITGRTYVERAVISAIKHDVAIYAIHTNLDNVLKDGVNGRIANRLQLTDIEVLARKEIDIQVEYKSIQLEYKNLDNQSFGSGVIGNLPHEMPESAFLAFLAESMNLHTYRHTPLTGKMVRKVAVCGGSGSFLLPQAIRSGAQCFVSADFKYHDFFDADGRIVVADIGHFESERFTMDLLAELIRTKFPNFAAHLTKTVTNPITYYSRK